MCTVKFQMVSVCPQNYGVLMITPPISLTCLMPLSYLSHHPPYLFLGVQWLDTVKVSTLCHMLESIWAHQSAQEVVFEWVQGSTLSHLGFDGGIIIRMSDSTMAWMLGLLERFCL
ncbi:hypothetical protein ACQJBY_015131 [Aegilops geniculata]